MSTVHPNIDPHWRTAKERRCTDGLCPDPAIGVLLLAKNGNRVARKLCAKHAEEEMLSMPRYVVSWKLIKDMC